MTLRSAPVRLILMVLLVGVGFGVGDSRPAYAVEQVARHTTRMIVNPDGALDVTTTMTFDGPAPARIEQRFATTEEIVGKRDYRFRVGGLRAFAAGREVGQLQSGRDHETLTIEPAGATEITVNYQVVGAAVRTGDGTTLVRWDPLQGLSLGVREVAGEVVIPGPFSHYTCVAGAPGTQAACSLAEGAPHDSLNPRYAGGPRAAGEITGPRLIFPATVVAANQDIEERWTLDRAFAGSGWPLAVALATLLTGAVLLYLLHRRAGTDAHPDGEPIEVGRFEAVGAKEFEFHPARDVLPGEVGTVADERVDPIDITATIIDLAVRGHLLIVELPRTSDFAPSDWKFVRMPTDVSELRPFERDLLDALAPADGSEVLASRMGPRVAAVIPELQSDLYDEVVSQGFFERRPDSTRNVWNHAALGLLLAGTVVTVLLAAFTSLGLTGLAVIAIALGLGLVAQEMPARTEKGARLLAGLSVLRGQLLTQPTDQMPKGKEYHELSEVLPYAIVLGGADRWLVALAAADADDLPDSTDLAWYHGPDNWHLRDLPDSLRNFITTVNGSLFAR